MIRTSFKYGRTAISMALFIILTLPLLSGISFGQNIDELESYQKLSIYDNFSLRNSELVSGGSGTSEDPWIIENVVIDNQSTIGIRIEATTDHFILRNCDISGANESTQLFFYGNSGILLVNVRNAVIMNNNIHNNTYGIQLYMCRNILLENNTFEDNNQYGVFVRNSRNISIDNNRMSNNGWGGMKVSYSNRCSIKNNVLENNTDGYGIFVESSGVNTISGNTIRSNFYGIFLRESSENSIFGNEIGFNENGLHMQGCQNNTVYHTNFMSNIHPASDDWQNQWHNASLKSGNHWDDYTGTGPYPIPGGSGSDEYPSIEPFEIYSEASASDWSIAVLIVIMAVAILVIAYSMFYFGRKARKKNVEVDDSVTDANEDGLRDR